MRWHPRFGPVVPEVGWAPGIRYLLRRDLVLATLAARPPGRVLEVGCGPGMLLSELSAAGHDVTGLETSDEAREAAARWLPALLSSRVSPLPDPEWRQRFSLLLAFEVLEHLEDDVGALAQWHDWLMPGGELLLSVPAHPSLWGDRDVIAGHVRRYGRAELLHRLADAGFVEPVVMSYGYPLANLVDRLGRWAGVWRRQTPPAPGPDGRAAATARSGSDRSMDVALSRLYLSGPGALLLRAACRVQKAFLDGERGNGWLVHARRR